VPIRGYTPVRCVGLLHVGHVYTSGELGKLISLVVKRHRVTARGLVIQRDDVGHCCIDYTAL